MSETPRLSASYRCDDCGEGDTHQRPATDGELRAAVLPLIDYEAAAKQLCWWLAEWEWEDIDDETAGEWIVQARSVVDAALGLKENE